MSFMNKSILSVLAVWVALIPVAVNAEIEARDIGGRLELFVDTYLVERFEGTSLQKAEPVPGEHVLAFDRPWEGPFCGYVSVLQNGDFFQAYYRGLRTAGKDGSDAEVTCYAESRDGLAWERPNLRLFEVGGTLDNNVILSGMAPFSHNFSPFLDSREGVPAEERYKALAGTSETGLYSFVSPDGIHWRKHSQEPVMREGAFDSQNVSFWSETEQQYVCYLRTWTTGAFEGIRTISRSTSKDFQNWNAPRQMGFGETPLEHLYTNQTLAYFRAPHLLISLAARFMPGRRVVASDQAGAIGVDERYSGDCSDTVLLTSRGGEQYDRTFMEAFVRPGLGLENWTSRTNYCSRGIIPSGPDHIAFYIQRHYGQDSHYLQRMLLRTDGFSSVHASYTGGEMITRPIRFEGSRLILNAATSAAGGIRVEIQDAAGTPLAGYSLADAHEFVGDQIDAVASWKGGSDLSALASQPVRLRFVMKDADLYSLQFRP